MCLRVRLKTWTLTGHVKGSKIMLQNMTAGYAVRRIEHAGATLRCLRVRSPSTLLARGRIEIVQNIGAEMGPERTRLAYPVPSARDVSLMDEALSWIWLIPNQVKRRVVSMRSQFHPYQEKNIISWRRCGREPHQTLGVQPSASGRTGLHRRRRRRRCEERRPQRR